MQKNQLVPNHSIRADQNSRPKTSQSFCTDDTKLLSVRDPHWCKSKMNADQIWYELNGNLSNKIEFCFEDDTNLMPKADA